MDLSSFGRVAGSTDKAEMKAKGGFITGEFTKEERQMERKQDRMTAIWITKDESPASSSTKCASFPFVSTPS